MGKELLNILDAAGNRGIKWTEALKQLEGQSSIRVDTAEFGEVIKALEREGLVKVVGERERRTIRRMEGS